LKSLWARGLRWDGVDPVDGLSQREWGELRGGEWVVVDGKTVALHVIDGQADRVFLCAKAGGVPKVLGHPISKLGSEEMRRRAVDRPGVDLMAASLNNDEQYLALWRRPKGVELWSVRAGDRLCAWPLSGAGGWPRRIVHGEEDPAFLPTLFALEGVGPQEDPWVQIRVYRLEFGVTEAESIGCLEVPWNHGGEEIEPIGFEGTSWRVGGREVRVGGRGCDD